jgi:asparagine synthase (glutamine-hydrolysing)
VWADDEAILVHERLAIVGLEHGSQPLEDPEREVVLAVNGEIYNHVPLAAGLTDPYPFQTGSDCEVILALYRERGADLVKSLNGIFAFVLWDRRASSYVIARDPIGVIPLYWGRDREGNLLVASELKALVDICPRVEEFPPGHILDSAQDDVPRRYFDPSWKDFAQADGVGDPVALRVAFEDAVCRQMMSEVPFGVLLSGGLDSSLVASVASRALRDGRRRSPWGEQVHTFAIGLADSPDLAAARRVAEALGTLHHEFRFTVQEGLDALADVIAHIESYDVTTVRASTPMFLMARRIRALGVKMVLSGEGADEIFGGYLYFHHAPDAEAFHAETVRKLDALSKYDCLRANKSMAAWGVEARVPFLDTEFLDHAMTIDPGAKRVAPGGIEKELLRRAFEGYLPHELLWRQKEQFSDGVGYSWIDSLKAHAEVEVSDDELARAEHRFHINPPTTKEAYLYRGFFEEAFPGDAAARCVPGGPSIACSTPAALAWDPSFAAQADPSGRAVRGVHVESRER